MKGVIFNLLEQVVSTQYGEHAWDATLEAAGLTGTYTAIGSYPDGDLGALVDSVAVLTNHTTDELLRWFGHASIPLLYQRYPGFFDPHRDARPFLLTLNDVIHPEVRKLFPGAYAPTFEFGTSDPEVLVLAYNSHRAMCAFAEGLIEGSAEHFGNDVVVEQTACVRRGDDRCVLRAKFASR